MLLIDRPAQSPLRRGSPSTLVVIALIVAAVTIGFALHDPHGEKHAGEFSALENPSVASRAICLVTLAVIASIASVVLSKRPAGARPGRIWIDYTIALALAAQFAALLFLWPVGEDHANSIHTTRLYLTIHNHRLYLYMTLISAFLILFSFMDLPSLQRWWFPGLLLFHLLLGFWTVRSSPNPKIDVWYFQEQGVEAFLHASNPYDASEINYLDIYHSTVPPPQTNPPTPMPQPVYGAGLVRNDHLLFGFPYPPLSLYCSTAGYLLGGDTRYAQAVALTLAGLFIGYCRPGRLPKLAAALLMFTPTVWFILGRAWTEPFVVLFLAATLFCACRNLQWMLPVAIGLLLASKQYLILALPLSFLLIPGFDWRSRESRFAWMALLLGALATAATITLPLAILNFPAFWLSTVTVQAHAPFRWDALSYLVALGHIDSRFTTWTWLWIAAALPAMLLAAWKSRRGPAGFAAAIALVYLVFISFNKQAFCNYYFFVIACFCCAIAAWEMPGSDTQK